MAKRRASSGDEVSLFPFLSILACLIGALIMIIVVMCVAQTQKNDGRTPEEVQRAKEHQAMLKELAQRKELVKTVKELLDKLKPLQVEQKDKEERLAKLRKLLSSSSDIQAQNKEMSQALIKELDNLLLEIEGLKTQMVETRAEIDKLLAELKKREIPKDKKPPPVVVQPSGSGTSNDKLYFIEASGPRLSFMLGDKKETVAATEQTIIASAPLNYFLMEISKNRNNAQLVFLMRDDGTTAYTRGGGWAQGKYGLKISRLLLPGQGDIDTKLFGEREGKVGPMPPDYQPPPPPEPKAP